MTHIECKMARQTGLGAWRLSALAAAMSCAAALGVAAPAFRLIPEPRLVSIATAAPDVLVLVFLDHDEDPPPSQAAAAYSVNGTAPRQVGRCSATVYEERCVDWRAQRYPQLLQHRLYLALALSPGH